MPNRSRHSDCRSRGSACQGLSPSTRTSGRAELRPTAFAAASRRRRRTTTAVLTSCRRPHPAAATVPATTVTSLCPGQPIGPGDSPTCKRAARGSGNFPLTSASRLRVRCHVGRGRSPPRRVREGRRPGRPARQGRGPPAIRHEALRQPGTSCEVRKGVRRQGHRPGLLDNSATGLVDRSGKKLSVGRERQETTATLVRADGSWKVSEITTIAGRGSC